MADPANTPLGKMVLDEITPVVMVLRTPLVEESCRKNNLSLVQMLSPFCNFNNIDVPVRTASDTPYRIRKFKLRLFYASDIRQPNIEAAKERLKDVISQAGETDVSEMYSDPPTVETVMTRSESEIVPSWFQYFNKELVRTLSFSEHETFDHPVACLMVVSSKDVQPINRFVDLFNTNQLPSLLNDGAMDPKILKHYLLLHDNQDGELDKASKVLTEMRNTFGLNDCQLLCINSASSGSADHPVNLWALNKMDSSLSQHIGGFLDADDLNEVRDLMQELSTRHIIPYMEQKIRILNQQVAATRKGFRNQIKSLWWRKGKDDAGDTSNGTMYTFSSIESQIRVLGDYAFMLRDYELALSNYRLISTDYKLDKSWKRYAGVQEMMGLTYFLLDQSRKDAESCMETAFSTYMNLGSSGLRNAIRCGLWWVEMLKARGQYKEAASVYFRIPGEEPLHSAVMLEQSSYCYLFCKPPMLRKYGFHLVLSGDCYRKCDQIKHAIRTYRGATSVYRGTTWSHAKDHVNFHIGKWYANLGIFDVAVAHMMEVLPCGHQSKTTQESFLNDFLRVVKETGRTFEVMGLKLPKINMSSLKVLFEDHRTYASPAAVSVKESVWRTMEEDLIPTLSTAKTNWLDSQPRLISKNYKELNVCVAGEAIKVEMEFRNPLQIPIVVTGVCLICELSARSDEKEHAVTGQEFQKDEETAILKIIRETSSGNSSFSLSEVDFSLAGGETIVVHLTVTPNVEGLLKLVGLKWKLSGSLTGFCGFESNLVKKKPPKARRKSRNSPRNNLQFMVIKSLPRLEGSIHSIPGKVFEGDVQRLLLELRNLSEYPVKNVKMKISHPRLLGIGSQEDLSKEFPAGILKNNNTNQSPSEAGLSKLPHSICKFPEDIMIHGKTSFSWPLWLRAAVPGNISLNLSIYYEMGDESSVIRYRTLRMLYSFLVLPSLDVSFQINPSPSRLEEFIVRMDVVNKTSSESFQVHQLSCVGYQWEVSLLYPVDRISSSQILTAGQATSCFFKLKKGKGSGGNVSSSTPLTSSDVVLGSESGEALYDIACSPLAGFHYSERLQQGISLPIHPSPDFVLISRPGRNIVDPDLSDNSHLFTHHACHCSLSRLSPISWRLDGPRTVQHDFSTSFVELKLTMTIYNSAEKIVSVRITTSDPNADNVGQSSDQVGWLDVPSSDVVGAPIRKPQPTIVSVSPFVWSGSSSTKVEIGPLSTIETPLQICVFSSGTFDLSNYQLHWSYRGTNEVGSSKSNGESSGVCQGYPYYLTALQSA